MIQAAELVTRGYEEYARKDSRTRYSVMATPAELVFLQSDCSRELVGSLRADSGLRAFARHAEREHELLLRLKERADCRLALAYTAEGTIVGQVTRVPADGWWEGIEHTYEIAIEVSAGWRGRGIARELLKLVADEEDWERMIVLAVGLSWHWDTEGMGINRFRYREVIKQLFGAYGFEEYLTAEENVQMDPANIMLVRIGSQVEREAIGQLFQRLFRSSGLPGL